MSFDLAFERLIGHEGGYVNHPADPGGETKFGISKRAYPSEDIKGLTLERAKELYRRDYWEPAGCEIVPPELRFDLFDMAVNAGPRKAIQALQAALSETPDGVIGPATLRALSIIPAPRVVARFAGHRLEHLASLPTWPTFGRGWARRIAQNLRAA